MKAKIKNWLLPGSLILSSVIIWELAVRILETPHYVLPGPLRVIGAMHVHMTSLASHAAVTLAEIALGFLLALVVGVGLAVLINISRTLERALMPLIIASQAVPVFAVAPLLILWFGYGLGSKVVMTAVIVFFPITINTARGLASIDPDTLALMKILEASNAQIFFKVRVPQALPFMFAGIRIGISVSVIGAVIGEWVGAREGLGFLMVQANAQLKVDLVFAAIVWLSVMGVVLYVLAEAAEKLCIPWMSRENDNNFS